MSFTVFSGILLLSLSYDHRALCNPTALTTTTDGGLFVFKRDIDDREEFTSILLSTDDDSGGQKIRSSNMLRIDMAEWKFLLQLLEALEVLHGRDKKIISSREFVDDELMQNDQPDEGNLDGSSSTASIVNNQSNTGDATANVGGLHHLIRERDKEFRLTAIKEQVLNMITRSHTTNDERNTLRMLYTNVHEIPTWLPDVYAQKTKFYFSSCNVPRHTKRDEWNAEDEFNLYFDINFPKPTDGTSLIVLSSQLRLYKLGSQIDITGESEEYLSELRKAIKQNDGLPDNVASASIMAAISEENQIHVSIYYYTRSLKRRRIKRTLLASSMLPRYQEGWTDWNIQRAVNAWKKDPSKNYGLSVVVEDDENNLINATKIFNMLNCSKQTSPVSSSSKIKSDADDFTARTTINGFWSTQIPNLEVKLIEIPNSEEPRALLYRYTKSALEQRILKDQQNVYYGENPEDEHRLRHNNHHRKVSWSLYNATNVEQDSLKNRSNQNDNTTSTGAHR